MPYDIRIVSTYPPRRCSIGTFTRDLANALEHFTGEVGSIRVAAINREGLPYDIPVDLVIDQYDPQSWQYAIKDVITRAGESPNDSVVLLQHEYGLDPGKHGKDGEGDNIVQMAKSFSSKGLITLAYLHTVLDSPGPHQKMVLQELAASSDGLIVPTENAIHILQSRTYGIDHAKLKHIDHGIRMHHPSQYDRRTIKEQYGLEKRFLITTLGMQSPDKGIQYGIRGYGRFLRESCTEKQRKDIVYLVAGQCHPDFIAANGGKEHQIYLDTLEGALQESGLTFCRTKELDGIDFDKYDLIFLDTFLDESVLLKLYAATNVMLLPYLNMQQISSGILADTIGSGRVAVSTKFKYALELIHSNKRCSEGVIMGRHARGILVDSGGASVEQIAEALDYLVFHHKRRLMMEKQAHQRGHQMRWHNTAWALLQHIEFIAEDKQMTSSRGVRFVRQRPSVYQKRRRLDTRQHP